MKVKQLSGGMGGQRRKKKKKIEKSERKGEREGGREGGSAWCSVVKHELGKTALSLTLYPMFLQLLLFGGGPLREPAHTRTSTYTHTHTHTLTELSQSPTPGALGCFSSSVSSTPVIKVRCANKTGRLPVVSGALPTCWVKKKKKRKKKRNEKPAPTELARFCGSEAFVRAASL